MLTEKTLFGNMAETGAPSYQMVGPGGVETFAIAEGPESPPWYSSRRKKICNLRGWTQHNSRE